MINAIYDYFRDCPLIENNKISVDYLGNEVMEYTIDVPPYSSIVKTYADGGKRKQFVFTFGSREYYGADVMQNLENSGFYNQLEKWIDDQNKLRNFPVVASNQRAELIEIDTPGYIFGSTEDTARYQIQMRFIYYETF